MKVISQLPPDYFYQYVKESNGWFIFQDKLTPMVRVYSPIPDLSELKEWCILVSMQYNKAEKTKYPYAVTFKLFPIDKANKNEKKRPLSEIILKQNSHILLDLAYFILHSL